MGEKINRSVTTRFSGHIETNFYRTSLPEASTNASSDSSYSSPSLETSDILLLSTFLQALIHRISIVNVGRVFGVRRDVHFRS